jgi:2-keto-3-deoxy-L-rhamnonate aldolase RhmA
MKQNIVKQKLQAGQLAYGGWITLPCPGAAEVMALSGLDFLVIDTEHGAINIESVQAILQAIAATDVVPIVRLAGSQRMFANKVLDTGPLGIIVPMVSSREEAEATVSAALYPPEGTRGIGLGRAQGYELDRREDYLKVANDLMLVVVQVEHRDGVERIEEIVSTPGIDLVFLGPADLAGSMGYRTQPGHPDVAKAIDRVAQAARRAKVPVGIPVSGPEDLSQRVKQGFQFFHIGVDTVYLGGACRRGLREAQLAGAGTLAAGLQAQ